MNQDSWLKVTHRPAAKAILGRPAVSAAFKTTRSICDDSCLLSNSHARRACQTAKNTQLGGLLKLLLVLPVCRQAIIPVHGYSGHVLLKSVNVCDVEQQVSPDIIPSPQAQHAFQC